MICKYRYHLSIHKSCSLLKNGCLELQRCAARPERWKIDYFSAFFLIVIDGVTRNAEVAFFCVDTGKSRTTSCIFKRKKQLLVQQSVAFNIISFFVDDRTIYWAISWKIDDSTQYTVRSSTENTTPVAFLPQHAGTLLRFDDTWTKL